ncbi:hypothetical protein [Pantoea sp. GL120224-02]|uniref:hypothetical protein n=1 Tax=Pantoea sp. GL120224-02 TaxID=1378084 RepID=UPI000BCCCA3E|nr:hypothetical protein [Pantoea sp. GL120224-02]SNY70962.1 hypothetical protein SAMN02744778_03108 [Pantoea sp. GL120224-02]
MRLFHGTSFSASQGIVSKGKILHIIERTYDESSLLPTTDGFVYLTDNIGYAIYVANKEAIFRKEQFLSVFQAEVNENELLPDFDELEYVYRVARKDAAHFTYADSLNKAQSCCIARSLNLSGDISKQLVLPSSINLSDPLRPLTRELIMLRKHGDHLRAVEMLQGLVWNSFGVPGK